MRDIEHKLQVGCYNYFQLQYPEYRGLLFAVPNGGRRDAVTGAKMKAEGVVAGVADMLLIIPNAHYNGLAIEFKTKTGRQSESQKLWQEKAEAVGWLYQIIRSFDEFKLAVDEYIYNSQTW